MAEEIFKRVEKKYLLNQIQKKLLMKLINKYIEPDKYNKYTICNIYFDTDNFDLIKTSIEKPLYKEKLRLRSYGIPKLNDKVFLEIKKKYKDVVSKRRVIINLQEVYRYLQKGIIPKCNKQIMNEINYMFDYYQVTPKMFVAYDRFAYHGIEDKNFRITFDYNIRSRDNDLYLEHGDYGEKLLKEDEFIMEVKILGGLPIWFTKILSDLKIYPISFSKYGNVYKNKMKEGMMV